VKSRQGGNTLGAAGGIEELGQCGLKVSLLILGWSIDETAYSDEAPKGGAGLAGPRKHHERSCGNLENHPKNRGISQVPHDVRFETLLKRRIESLCRKTEDRLRLESLGTSGPRRMKKNKSGETLPKQLLRLKKQTSWSWERMCREFHRVMGHEGPSHTTLYRYAKGKGKRPHVVTERYVQQALEKVTAELSTK